MSSTESEGNLNYSDSDVESSSSSEKTRPPRNLMHLLDKVDQSRYEKFRQAGFNKNMMRRLCFEVIGQSCNPKFIIAVSGLAKVFVGELIDIAKEVQKEEGSGGPLLRSHIYEAYRRMYKIKPNMRINVKNPWP
jgi:transcription initiation factor TFIID subunit 11